MTLTIKTYKNKKKRRLFALLIICLIGGCIFMGDDGDVEINVVQKVIDGDTVELKNGDRVRFLGIDTPEVRGDKPYSKAAKEFTQIWLDTHDEHVININKTDSKTGKGKFGRRLCWLVDEKNGEVLNVLLVKNGLAQVKLYGNKHLIYESQLWKAQINAQENGRGIWTKN